MTASWRSWVALQMVSNALNRLASSDSPWRSSIAARNIWPTSSDSELSIVVWLAHPIRSRCTSGSKPGDAASANAAMNA